MLDFIKEGGEEGGMEVGVERCVEIDWENLGSFALEVKRRNYYPRASMI